MTKNIQNGANQNWQIDLILALSEIRCIGVHKNCGQGYANIGLANYDIEKNEFIFSKYVTQIFRRRLIKFGK